MSRLVLTILLTVPLAAPARESLKSVPPREESVLRALPKPPPGMVRVDVGIVQEEVAPYHWKCTVTYRRGILLPFGLVFPGEARRAEVYIHLGPPAEVIAPGAVRHGIVKSPYTSLVTWIGPARS
jgi:hypothetical protein